MMDPIRQTWSSLELNLMTYKSDGIKNGINLVFENTEDLNFTEDLQIILRKI